MATRRKVIKRADVIDLSGKILERDLQVLAKEYITLNDRRKELKETLTKALMKSKKKVIETDLGSVQLGTIKTRSIDASRLYNALPKSEHHLLKEVVSVNVGQATELFGTRLLRKITQVKESFRLKTFKPKKEKK